MDRSQRPVSSDRRDGIRIWHTKKLPTDDDCFGPGTIRADGRKIHPSYLFRVKPAAELREPGAVYTLLATTPADQAFRPMSEGGCPLVKG